MEKENSIMTIRKEHNYYKEGNHIIKKKSHQQIQLETQNIF